MPRGLPRRVFLVGVFVNASEDDVLRVARNVDLNAVQLHGEETPADVQALSESYPVIKAFRVRGGFRSARLAALQRRDGIFAGRL